MEISVQKLTDIELLHKANSMTTGKESKMSLFTCYKTMHSNMRTQLFWIELRNIPSFVVGHLVRHIHAQPFVQSKRTDRGSADFNDVCRNLAFRIGTCWIFADGKEPTLADIRDTCDSISDEIESMPEKFDRLAPQSMAMLVSAEEIVAISRVRLCNCASNETRRVWAAVKKEIAKVDSGLAKFMVPTCIFRGVCPELKCCGFINSTPGKKILEEYQSMFK